MKVSGLQKLTLLDFPGKVAAILFLGGCNFRCPFCQNGPLVLAAQEQPSIEPEELRRFLKRRAGILDGICVTGGEPTLHADLPDLLAEIKSFSYLTKLDTNGSNPDMLEALIRDGLIDYAAIDIKAGRGNYARVCGLSAAAAGSCSGGYNPASSAGAGTDSPAFASETDRHAPAAGFRRPAAASISGGYGFLSAPGADTNSPAFASETDRHAPAAGFRKPAAASISGGYGFLSAPGADTDTGNSLLGRVSRSVRILMNSRIDYEFRTTVVRGLHTEEDFKDIADWICGCRHYFLQTFRDSDGILTPNHSFSAFSAEEMRHFLDITREKIPAAELRGI